MEVCHKWVVLQVGSEFLQDLQQHQRIAWEFQQHLGLLCCPVEAAHLDLSNAVVGYDSPEF